MSDIIIVIAPAFRDGKRLHDRFDAHLRETGELICCATRQPLLDGARELLKVGHGPIDVICTVWSHSPEVVAMKATIGVAARFDVMGEKFVRRKIDCRAYASIKIDVSGGLRSPPI